VLPPLQSHVAALAVDEQILNYAVRMVRAARDWHGIEVGPGPRGPIALLRAGRAEAFLQGREFVTPDDIKSVAPAVLRHRIRLTTDLEIEGYRPDDVLADLLDNIPAPRQ
jgi:MoxR-like ATPase